MSPGVPEQTDPEPPRWFIEALSQVPTSERTDVDGCPIHFLSWGEVGSPGLLLVHGGAAHARWWSFIAPKFSHDHHVVAIDLSGHGDSGWRDEYSINTWADEVACVARAAGMAEPPIVAGHSMGGFVTTVAAATHGDDLAGAVIIDSPITRPDPETEEGTRGRAFQRPKTYPDLPTALEHFHLIPQEPPPAPHITDWVARTSLRRVDGGWTWKFDPRIFHDFSRGAIYEHLAAVRCRVAVMRGEFSDLVTSDVSDFMYDALGRSAPIVEVPEAYHHIPLDQPLSLVTGLRALLADWDHSIPRRRPASG